MSTSGADYTLQNWNRVKGWMVGWEAACRTGQEG